MRFLPLLLFAACAGGVDGGCTEIGCVDGFDLAFTHAWTEGSYTVAVSFAGGALDGQTVVCTATIPIDETTNGCNDDRVLLGLSGSMLPVAQQAISGLTITTSDTTSITVSVNSATAELGNKTFTPSWTTSQPNGPECEPTCRSASDTWSF